MEIFLTLQSGELMGRFFSPDILDALRALGTLRMNTFGRVMTEAELAAEVGSADVCIVMPWQGSAKFTGEVLDRAPNLRLIVSPGGSVTRFATEAVYERGIVVCSANNLMARYVAEGVLTYILAGLRDLPLRNHEMKRGIWNPVERDSLVGNRLGLIGLGSVGRHLLDFLKPFDVKVQVYDPYISRETLADYGNVTFAGLEELLQTNDIISIHASSTPETRGMLSKERLALIKDGALLVNSARGSLIDEPALIAELSSGRISAVLDVFETDGPLLEGSRLRELDNVIVMPHVAGYVRLQELTRAMVMEIRRFQEGEPLQYRIPVGQFRLMTV